MSTVQPELVPVPTFVRLLAGVLEAQASPPRAFHQALEQWLDWARAVALSRALDAEPAVGDPVPAADFDVPKAKQRLREQILDAASWATAAAATDAMPLLRAYQALQRKLQASSGRLRGELRAQLAQQGPAQARLAELDALMEGVLSVRESSLFAQVPELLAARFAQLQMRAPAANQGELLPLISDDGQWRQTLLRDAKHVLLAELDARFLPIDGLQAALQPE